MHRLSKYYFCHTYAVRRDCVRGLWHLFTENRMMLPILIQWRLSDSLNHALVPPCFHGKGCHQLLNDNNTSLHKACNCSDEICNTNWFYFFKCNKLTYRLFIIQVFTDVRHPNRCIKEPEHHHP